MNNRLSPSEKELYRRTDEVLLYIWDPIGVSGVPQARDEYESYVPKVFSILSSSTDGKDIAKYLTSVERDMMGLNITQKSEQRAQEISDILIDYREWIHERPNQGVDPTLKTPVDSVNA